MNVTHQARLWLAEQTPGAEFTQEAMSRGIQILSPTTVRKVIHSLRKEGLVEWTAPTTRAANGQGWAKRTLRRTRKAIGLVDPRGRHKKPPG